MSYPIWTRFLEYLKEHGLEKAKEAMDKIAADYAPLALQDPPNLIRSSMGEMHAKLQGMRAGYALDVYVTIDGKVCGEFEAEQAKSYGHVGRYEKTVDQQQFYDDVMLTWKFLSVGVTG